MDPCYSGETDRKRPLESGRPKPGRVAKGSRLQRLVKQDFGPHNLVSPLAGICIWFFNYPVEFFLIYWVAYSVLRMADAGHFS